MCLWVCNSKIGEREVSGQGRSGWHVEWFPVSEGRDRFYLVIAGTQTAGTNQLNTDNLDIAKFRDSLAFINSILITSYTCTILPTNQIIPSILFNLINN